MALIKASWRLALVGALVLMGSARAGATVVAVEQGEANAPVLWEGGVAWWSSQGIRTESPGTPSRLLARFPQGGGLTYNEALDSGSGTGAAPQALAYGWEEANDMVPPMGPGDQNVPRPAIPYETSITRRGLISADGSVTKLSGCGAEAAFSIPSYEISIVGGLLAYGCEETAPSSPSGVGSLALPQVGALGTTTATESAVDGPFQLSGSFLAYASGEPLGAGKVVVKDLSTNSVSYEVPHAAGDPPHALAMQQDGTLVVLESKGSQCLEKDTLGGFIQAYPAAWYSPTSPTAHPLGCFYASSLRPVGGEWVALQPGPGTRASLVLVDLATGAARPLAVFPNARMFKPTPSEAPVGLAPTFGADFDGQHLTWLTQTCAGVAVQLASEVSAISPGPVPSSRCPVSVGSHELHVGPRGALHLRLSCPLGCRVDSLAIRSPHVLSQEGPALFSLPASGSTSKTLHLSRRQLAYLRRRHRVKSTLSVLTASLGGLDTKSSFHMVLVG